MLTVKTQKELSQKQFSGICNDSAYHSYLKKINAYSNVFNGISLTDEEEKYIQYLSYNQDLNEFQKLISLFKKLRKS